jgi:glycosyltransferase 2 family protein
LASPTEDSAEGSGAPALPPAPGGALKRRLKPALLVVVLVFVGYSLRDIVQRWDGSRLQLSTAWLLAAFAPLALGCVLQAWGWIGLIERMSGRRVPARAAMVVYMESQLARYSPGMVGLPIVRMAGADRLGVAAATIGSSIALEMLQWTALGGAIGFSSLLWLPQKEGLLALLGQWALPIVALFMVGVLVMLFVDRRLLPGFVVRVLRLSGAGPLVPLRLTFANLLYWVTWLLHGTLLGLALGVAPLTALPSSGAYVLGCVGGFLALAAPAGAGVREGVITLTLSPLIGASSALAAAVVSRALSLAADVVVWLVYKAWLQRGAGTLGA